MRSLELAKRNAKVMYRDPLSLAANAGLPVLLLIVLQAFERVDAVVEPSSLAPGVVLFGFAMLTITSARSIAQDRESSLFDRLLTTPLSANDVVLAYSAPYLVIAAVQAVAVFAVAGALGTEFQGSLLWVGVTLLAMAVLSIGVGMLIGTTVPRQAAIGPWIAILLLTIFGGAWIGLDHVGGAVDRVASVLPFAQALDAVRRVLVEGSAASGGADLFWVAAYAVGVAVCAVAVFRRRMTG